MGAIEFTVGIGLSLASEESKGRDEVLWGLLKDLRI